ncbi:MAG: hypothetical protein GXO01_00925 [Epsilonproteobacteria bacterium]|nr:hypothetical protein [Campylobacterota bacterium]
MFYLPSKEECDYIVENSKQFFRKDSEFLGKEVAVYHYKQGDFEEFKKYNAWELRALTFIKNDGKWERFLGIHKFFELNQAPGWMVEDLIDKKIIKVQEKIDGTLMQPILIDGKIYFKSKLRFDSYQALRSNEILKKSPNLKEFILKCYDEGKIPLFEYVSEKSQVVMDYGKEALILIQVRDLKTGEYDLEFEKKAQKYNVECAPVCEPKPLRDYLEEKEVCVSKEGWVLIFEDMKFVKLKTDEYLKRHKILGDIKENNIIQMALDRNIDDLYGILNPKSEKYEYVKEIHELFNKKYHNLKRDIKKALKLPKSEMKKRFANHPQYEVIALCHKRKDLSELDEWLKKQTKKLKGAKKFLERE